jgi:pSer/pThr/pTyr-binding forkhead associated (FHA) protein
MRCSMCGHESPAGSSFCLNCGASLTQTPPPVQGLPAALATLVCGVCRGENPAGMKFCRACGNALPQAATASPAFGVRVRSGPTPGPGAPGPVMAGIPSGPLGGPMPGMPPGPVGGFPPLPAGGFPSAPAGGVPAFVAGMANERSEPTMRPSAVPMSPALMPTMAPDAGRVADGSTMACPRCGTQTPLGFAYCQQCGLHMEALQPTDPGAHARQRSPSAAPPMQSPMPMSLRADAPIDPHAGTLAQDDAGPVVAAARAPAVRPSGGLGWGTAVLVNRDGSDGQRYPLAGEYLVVGRTGADIAFDDDRFLARQHARFERGPDGSVTVHPLDSLNGVFRKTDAPVELGDGMVVLLGREVLRYERVDPEEAKLHPLVRHGTALFGSPPREPWGRLIQLVPSGGYRDIRHLAGAEVVLGREEGDIVFRDDAFMSRRHAAVTWDGRRAQITDLGSSNGTFVRLTGPTVLRHGDHVRMGDQLLRIELGR